jgi:hypothetical protein
MGFRVKLVMFLVVYFGGIATGIYLAMPGETQLRTKTKAVGKQQARPASAFKSNEMARAARNGMEKCVAVGKSTSDQISDIIKAYTGNQDVQP